MNTPNIDPASDDSLPAILEDWFDYKMMTVENSLPCEVLSVSGNSVTVRPLVQVKSTDGQGTSRGTYTVPIKRNTGGGKTIYTPIKAGDFGHIRASDRDTSLVYQSKGEAIPNTNRKHSFADGVFEPDAAEDIPPPAGHEDALVLQSEDGANFVAVGDDYIHAEAQGNKLEINSTGIKLTVGGQVVELNSSGLWHNGVNIGFPHTHGGVTVGTDNTGVVTP